MGRDRGTAGIIGVLSRIMLNLPRRAFGQWLAAAIVGCAAGTVMAAPKAPKGQGAAKAAAPTAPKAGEGGSQTIAPYAILVEAESGSVLLEKSADELIPPASLSK